MSAADAPCEELARSHAALSAVARQQRSREAVDLSADVVAATLALVKTTLLHSSSVIDTNAALATLALLLSIVRASADPVLDADQRSDVAELLWTCWPDAAGNAAGLNVGGLIAKARAATEDLIAVGDPAVARRLLDHCTIATLASKQAVQFLTLLASHDVAAVLERIPDLFERCVGGLERDDLAPGLCKLAVLARDGEEERSADAVVAAALDERRTTNVSAQLYPALVKGQPSLIRPVLDGLARADDVGGNARLRSIMALASIGIAAGVLQRSDLSVDLLSRSFDHSSDQLRLSALSLVIEPSTSSAPLSDADLDLVGVFFERETGTADPDFRQRAGGLLRRLLDRLRLSSYAAARDAKRGRLDEAKHGQAEEYVERVRRSLESLIALAVHGLRPAAPYRIQIGSTHLLLALLQTGLDTRWRGTLIKALVPLDQRRNGKAPPTLIVWPFALDVLNESLARALVRRLTSTYDDVRDEAMIVLRGFGEVMPGFERIEDELVQPAFALMDSRREAETTTAALVLELVMLSGRADGLFERVVERAEANMARAEVDLADAAQSSPVHGPLMAVRRLLAVKPSLLDAGLLERLMAIVHRVWTLVEPVLCNAAPTGEESADHEDTRAMQLAGPDDDGMDGDGGEPRHKIILSAAFRAMKEIAYLLEALICLASALWSAEALASVGDLFADWLQRIRHRGAFTAVFPRLSRVCAVLSADHATSSMPRRWLDTHLAVIASPEPHLTTRRSAGLPYCVMAILAGTVASPVKPSLVDVAMSSLFDTAEGDDSIDDARVHAMNTLRVLFIERDLAGSVKPHIERGFRLVFRSFASPNWSVRNVSMLLYAALVHRTFGARASTSTARSDRATLGRRMSSLDFFRNYPTLHPLLLGELSTCLESNLHDLPSSDMQSSLYSVLLLLALLQTDGNFPDQAKLVEPFLSLIQHCSASRVWMIREAAAGAMTALVSPLGFAACAERLLARGPMSENELHGRLLQTLRLLQALTLPADSVALVAQLLDARATEFLNPLAHSPAVRAAVLDIATVLGSLSASTPAIVDLASQQASTIPSLSNQQQPGLGGLVASSDRLLKRGCTSREDAASAVQPGSTLSFDELVHRYESATGAERSDLLSQIVEAAKLQPAHLSRALDLLQAAARPEEAMHKLDPQELTLAQFMESELDRLDISSSALAGAPSRQLDEAQQPSPGPSAIDELKTRRLRILLELIEDDDEDVRAAAQRSTGTDVHLSLIVRSTIRSLVDSADLDDLVSSIMLRGCDEAIASLSSPSRALFAEEPPNLYRDDLYDAELLRALLRLRAPLDLPTTRATLAQHLSAFERVVSRTDAAANLPLGPLSDRQAWRTAWQLVATSALVSPPGREDSYIESLRIAVHSSS